MSFYQTRRFRLFYHTLQSMQRIHIQQYTVQITINPVFSIIINNKTNDPGTFPFRRSTKHLAVGIIFHKIRQKHKGSTGDHHRQFSRRSRLPFIRHQIIPNHNILSGVTHGKSFPNNLSTLTKKLLRYVISFNKRNKDT